ncbi:MAG: RdgB/HAM1 family non-canonical purine NTP pyrophosphatase [Caldilineales bacterium]
MPPTKLLIATHNPGKVREYRDLLADLPVAVTWLDDEGVTFEVDETGATFAKNAILKARAYAAATGLLTWADDSGLEVDALDGAPGVYSARYGAPEVQGDEARFRYLLANLAGVPEQERTARFRCVVALSTPDGDVQTVDGTCEGRIGFDPRGDNGFGYDPVFLVAEYDHQVMLAELEPAVKNRISHRGQAARKAKVKLAQMLARQEDLP